MISRHGVLSSGHPCLTRVPIGLLSAEEPPRERLVDDHHFGAPAASRLSKSRPFSKRMPIVSKYSWLTGIHAELGSLLRSGTGCPSMMKIEFQFDPATGIE